MQEIYKTFIDILSPFPYCDIAATGVLMKIAELGNAKLFSDLVLELLKHPPSTEKIRKGSKVLLFAEDIEHLEINFEDDIDAGEIVSDFLPYAILSQLCGYPLGIVDEDDKYAPYAFHLYLLNEVGSNKNFLRRGDARSLNNMKSLETIEMKDVGQLISGHEGIIEPIVQSIVKCFFRIPLEIEKLYDRAFEENNVNLLYRIYLALRTLIKFENDQIANQAKSFVTRFNKYFNILMADLLSKDIVDPKEKESLKAKLLSIKIDEQTDE